ncbi:HNH endonuclease [Limimaricola variabilis]|uniref:HNH endonuclease n=1 Tax=Limimaricola variabilis TaxID=1492771 RepID=UPI002AC9B41F|nr:HNH endonuclease [Limimaricola variabilis]WPY93171.1 HNH endonuclease [Limimaricola variabilis]
MARLKQLGQPLRSLAPRLSYAERPSESRERDARHAWRSWYKTARWQALRWEVLVEAAFTCVRCHRIEGDTSLLVADHKSPHRGDPALFWDRGNLQCLCKGCHDGAKQREERRRFHQGGNHG